MNNPKISKITPNYLCELHHNTMHRAVLVLAALYSLCCCHAACGVSSPIPDENGYLMFCLCMGRFGNQAEHLLGGLAFAKAVNRTLVVPPWRTSHKNIAMTDWFKFEPLTKYHRVILPDEFMNSVAPTIWPPDQRVGHCFAFNKDANCDMKVGEAFGAMWHGLGIEFVTTETYDVSYTDPSGWRKRFPASQYPVVALKGAPAAFPMKTEHQHLHKFIHWSDAMVNEGNAYIEQHFPAQKFIGIHLRNGVDWKNACQHAHSTCKYMASPQCIDPSSGEKVTMEICFPSTESILRSIEEVVVTTGAKVVYVATDKNPLLKEITSHLHKYQVEVFHQDPYLPQQDLYILGQSDHFIGNCISSFTSFVSRERSVNNKPTTFWGRS